MLFNVFTSKKRTRYVAMCDIANGSVGSALVALPHNRTPEILFTFRTPLPYEAGTQEVLPGLTHALTEALTQLLSAVSARLPSHEPLELRAFVHAPWCATVTEKIELPFNRETTVSKKLLQTLLARAMEDVEPENMVCIDRQVLRIALNGYAVEDPIGKRAQSAEITIARSFLESRIYALITNIFGQQFPNHSLEIDAFVFSLLQQHALWKNTTSATIIDIGGLYTTSTIVREGNVIETHVMPFGHRALLQIFCGLYQDTTHAETQLQLYFTNSATPSQTQKIEDLLNTQEAPAVRILGDAFTAMMQKNGKIPHHVFLSVGTSLAPWFEKLLGKIDFAQFTTTSKPFEVSLLHNSLAHTTVRTALGVTPDQMLTLAVHLLVRP